MHDRSCACAGKGAGEGSGQPNGPLPAGVQGPPAASRQKSIYPLPAPARARNHARGHQPWGAPRSRGAWGRARGRGRSTLGRGRTGNRNALAGMPEMLWDAPESSRAAKCAAGAAAAAALPAPVFAAAGAAATATARSRRAASVEQGLGPGLGLGCHQGAAEAPTRPCTPRHVLAAAAAAIGRLFSAAPGRPVADLRILASRDHVPKAASARTGLQAGQSSAEAQGEWLGGLGADREMGGEGALAGALDLRGDEAQMGAPLGGREAGDGCSVANCGRDRVAAGDLMRRGTSAGHKKVKVFRRGMRTSPRTALAAAAAPAGSRSAPAATAGPAVRSAPGGAALAALAAAAQRQPSGASGPDVARKAPAGKQRGGRAGDGVGARLARLPNAVPPKTRLREPEQGSNPAGPGLGRDSAPPARRGAKRALPDGRPGDGAAPASTGAKRPRNSGGASAGAAAANGLVKGAAKRARLMAACNAGAPGAGSRAGDPARKPFCRRVGAGGGEGDPEGLPAGPGGATAGFGLNPKHGSPKAQGGASVPGLTRAVGAASGRSLYVAECARHGTARLDRISRVAAYLTTHAACRCAAELPRHAIVANWSGGMQAAALALPGAVACTPFLCMRTLCCAKWTGPQRAPLLTVQSGTMAGLAYVCFGMCCLCKRLATHVTHQMNIA